MKENMRSQNPKNLDAAGEALRASELRYRRLFESAKDGILILDAETGMIVDVNPFLIELLGISREVFLGKKIWEIGFLKDIAANEDKFAELQAQEHIRYEDLPLETAAGLPIAVEFVSNVYRVNGHRVIQCNIRDITKRKQAEKQLYILNKTLEDRVAQRTAEAERRARQLRQLAAQLTLAEQRERQRIAMVLHDGLQQILVAAKFHIALLEKTKNVPKLTAKLAELVNDAIETSRSLTAELSPPILQQGGLIPALEWLVKWMRDKHGLTVSLASQGKIDPAPEEVVILLFQSVRELLFNVAKHAGIKTARVEIIQEAGQIRVEVDDEGVGFDPIQLQGENAKSGGMGLFSIQERLSYLGGSIEINSSPGSGSRFKLSTPPISTKTVVPPIDKKSSVSITIASQRDATASSEKKIRIILVDDHMVMRQGLAGLLQAEPDIEIIGEASDGQSGVDLIRELRPDVVLMDISMPGMDGIQATRIIHKEHPEVRIIGLSMFQEGKQSASMREAGAVGYLTKTGPADVLIEAIRACAQVSKKSFANESPKATIQ
jgi:PAS domain S-box-containing protein